MRTLRMLSEINVVLQTIVEALPLFLQACFLIFFLQMVFALICMSLWSGGLNFECQAGAGISASSSALDSNSSNNATLLAAPKLGEAFKCPLAVDCTTGEDEWELTWCTAIEPPRFIRSEAYGFTGFDNFLQAMLTMFGAVKSRALRAAALSRAAFKFQLPPSLEAMPASRFCRSSRRMPRARS